MSSRKHPTQQPISEINPPDESPEINTYKVTYAKLMGTQLRSCTLMVNAPNPTEARHFAIDILDDEVGNGKYRIGKVALW